MELTNKQKTHYENCPYVETCELCKWITKQLNLGKEMDEIKI